MPAFSKPSRPTSAADVIPQLRRFTHDPSGQARHWWNVALSKKGSDSFNRSSSDWSSQSFQRRLAIVLRRVCSFYRSNPGIMVKIGGSKVPLERAMDTNHYDPLLFCGMPIELIKGLLCSNEASMLESAAIAFAKLCLKVAVNTNISAGLPGAAYSTSNQGGLYLRKCVDTITSIEHFHEVHTSYYLQKRGSARRR